MPRSSRLRQNLASGILILKSKFKYHFIRSACFYWWTQGFLFSFAIQFSKWIPIYSCVKLQTRIPIMSDLLRKTYCFPKNYIFLLQRNVTAQKATFHASSPTSLDFTLTWMRQRGWSSIELDPTVGANFPETQFTCSTSQVRPSRIAVNLEPLFLWTEPESAGHEIVWN